MFRCQSTLLRRAHCLVDGLPRQRREGVTTTKSSRSVMDSSPSWVNSVDEVVCGWRVVSWHRRVASLRLRLQPSSAQRVRWCSWCVVWRAPDSSRFRCDAIRGAGAWSGILRTRVDFPADAVRGAASQTSALRTRVGPGDDAVCGANVSRSGGIVPRVVVHLLSGIRGLSRSSFKQPFRGTDVGLDVVTPWLPRRRRHLCISLAARRAQSTGRQVELGLRLFWREQRFGRQRVDQLRSVVAAEWHGARRHTRRMSLLRAPARLRVIELGAKFRSPVSWSVVW